MNMNLGYSLAVEKLCGMKIPEKAQVIRVIIAEMNRIASHLVGMGAYGLDLGTFSPFLYAFREREMILDLFEEVCGARLTYSYITIGGVHDDLPDGLDRRCRSSSTTSKPRIPEYHALLTDNHIFVKRTADIGVMSPQDALGFGLTGPVLRGSGIKWDLRKCMPYDIYDRFEFDVPVGEPGGSDGIPRDVVVGDCWSRYWVRMLEMRQSIRIIRQCLKQIPGGDFKAKVPKNMKLPESEVYFEAENPRGQLGFLIVGDGSAIPYRVKARRLRAFATYQSSGMYVAKFYSRMCRPSWAVLML